MTLLLRTLHHALSLPTRRAPALATAAPLSPIVRPVCTLVRPLATLHKAALWKDARQTHLPISPRAQALRRFVNQSAANAGGDDAEDADGSLSMHRQQMQDKTTNEIMAAIRLSIHRAAKRVDWAEQRSRLQDLSVQTDEPSFWSDPNRAQLVVKEKGRLQDRISQWDRIQAQYQQLTDLINLARQDKDYDLLQEVSQDLDILQIEAKDFEIETVFDKPEDSSPCFLEVHAGAGGTESTDWAQILLRMYTRYADRQGFKVELLDESKGDAGIKSACIKIDGDYAFGWLKNESGVHRLVRVSPFDSQSRRHTSFASILVYPAVNDEIHIDINPKDLLVDTMRSSGAGGQHVNKTESAVRLTHIPSGIVVVCSNDRSQHRNRAMAMETLRSRLYALEQKKKAEQKAQTASTLGDNSWGNQIRSYVLHPYQLIKDLRSDFETGDVESILDGDIESMLASNLLSEPDEK